MVVVVQRVGEDVPAEIAPVRRQRRLVERIRAADQLTRHHAARSALAKPVLHRLDLHVVPVGPERADDAAMVRHVTIPVRRAFPDAHRCQVRWLPAGNLPLVDPVIADAVQPDPAVAPVLRSGPLDAVVEVLRLARAEMVHITRRPPATTAVDAHARVAVRHPFLRIDHLPVLVAVARSGGHVRMLLNHAVPGARIAVLEQQTFGIGPVGEQHRMPPFDHRAKHVGAQLEAIIHLDDDVPIDAHTVAYFAGGHAGVPQGGFAVLYFRAFSSRLIIERQISASPMRMQAR